MRLGAASEGHSLGSQREKISAGCARNCGKDEKKFAANYKAVMENKARLRRWIRKNAENLIVLGAVAGLIALCLFILHLYSRNAALERCVEEGRHDCLQIPAGNSG